MCFSACLTVSNSFGILTGRYHRVEDGCQGEMGAQQVREPISAMLCSLHRIGWSMENATTLKDRKRRLQHLTSSLRTPRRSRLGFASRWEWLPSGQASDAALPGANAHQGTARRRVPLGAAEGRCLWWFVAGGLWTLQDFEAVGVASKALRTAAMEAGWSSLLLSHGIWVKLKTSSRQDH